MSHAAVKRSPILILTLLGVLVGIGALSYLRMNGRPRSPREKLGTVPAESIRGRSSEPLSPTSVAPREVAHPRRVEWEERFTDLKEEGRRMRSALLENDARAALAYEVLARRADYRELLDRRHQIEAGWSRATDDQREGMLAEMNSLRQRGVALILAEMAKGEVAPAPKVAPLTTTPDPAPAPAVVFQ